MALLYEIYLDVILSQAQNDASMLSKKNSAKKAEFVSFYIIEITWNLVFCFLNAFPTNGLVPTISA